MARESGLTKKREEEEEADEKKEEKDGKKQKEMKYKKDKQTSLIFVAKERVRESARSHERMRTKHGLRVR